MSIKWEELFNLSRKDDKVPVSLLCLDPGETTGYAIFHGSKLTSWGQTATVNKDDLLWNNLEEILMSQEHDFVVCENYRVYQHKLDRHSFSAIPTLRLIGAIDYHCWKHHRPVQYQMASQAKAFVTDRKLKEWGFWKEGMKHSRDAIRHGLYFLLFYKRGEDIL